MRRVLAVFHEAIGIPQGLTHATSHDPPKSHDRGKEYGWSRSGQYEVRRDFKDDIRDEEHDQGDGVIVC